MIGRLRGTVAEVGAGEAMIDVGGVGYIVQCGTRTLAHLIPDAGTVLHIDSQTREDGTRLYGFLDREERATFVQLLVIQGVGPKAALAVLDVLSPHELARAAALDDKAAVARANGVGPKLAARIVVELKDKPLTLSPSAIGFMPPPGVKAPSGVGETVAALMALGLPEAQARLRADAAGRALGTDAAVEDLIKSALREMST
jgi:Holliday junction DNA helicase RuvA